MAASRLYRVAVIVLEGAKPLDVGIPAQVFTTRASMPYEVRVCGATPSLVTGGDGLAYYVAHGLDALEWADIVFVPGYRFPDRDDPTQTVVDALIAAHDRGARLAAISTRTFALAAAGLLDGRRATTHWHYTRALMTRHPLVRVDENVLFVDEGSVLTSASAAKAIGLVLPNLDGKLSGDSIRVPVPVGSIVELNTTVARDVTRDDVLAAYRTAAEGPLAGILEYSEDPLVSSDITGNPASAIFDSALTRVDGRHIKVVAWYDNEWGFSNRVIDTLELLATG